MKKIVKKVIINIFMAIMMMAIGYSVATAMYSAGFRFNLPKITIEYDTEDHDLRLIDFAADGEPLATEVATK
jgi:hypothetical protein